MTPVRKKTVPAAPTQPEQRQGGADGLRAAAHGVGQCDQPQRAADEVEAGTDPVRRDVAVEGEDADQQRARRGGTEQHRRRPARRCPAAAAAGRAVPARISAACSTNDAFISRAPGESAAPSTLITSSTAGVAAAAAAGRRSPRRRTGGSAARRARPIAAGWQSRAPWSQAGRPAPGRGPPSNWARDSHEGLLPAGIRSTSASRIRGSPSRSARRTGSGSRVSRPGRRERRRRPRDPRRAQRVHAGSVAAAEPEQARRPGHQVEPVGVAHAAGQRVPPRPPSGVDRRRGGALEHPAGDVARVSRTAQSVAECSLGAGRVRVVGADGLALQLGAVLEHLVARVRVLGVLRAVPGDVLLGLDHVVEGGAVVGGHRSWRGP